VNSDTPPAPKRGLHRPPPPPPKTLSQQEKEDLQIAGFYMNDNNYRGAYGRAQDAVKIDDANPDAHLALAEAARHMGKLDEAEQNYRRVLQLDPVPKARKKAEQALKDMTGGS
jgi:Tfp pilus assembly protein PilF